MIVSFQDYVPAPRYDGTPWTQVTVEEGAAEAGPWTLIDTIALSPFDTDPKNPQARSFTTTHATLVEGWYRVSFKDAGGNILRVTPIHNVDQFDTEYVPTVSLVARKIMSRTKDQFGVIQGSFTPTTTPTDTQVANVINDVMSEVADVIGDDVPEPLMDDAANVAALKAAMQIELDFYSDQVNSGRSVYPQLKEQYDSALASLQAQVLQFNAGSTDVTLSGTGGSPSYAFPEVTNDWLTRRM